MREIKFRAYMEDVNADWTDEESQDKFEMIYDFAFEEYNTVNDELRLTENLMQYTGLKDKNGVEIYEGDIVKGSAYGKEIYTGSVYFYDKAGAFIMKIIDNEGAYYRLDKLTFQRLEIIGNIHENKDLLDEK